ncbi:MAG: DUF3883 domain-containing protein [Deltaproteobacteria bacterium]|nr:DUF3883 domain-containing protein [Deltaproteobacteria bacterium]
MDTSHGLSAFEREVVDKTLGEIRTFLDQIANGSRQYLTIHNLTEQIEHQYHGRFVIELLQNAHDALQTSPREASRRIEFVLDTSVEPHGVLYVANDGRPFRREDLRALANLGQSSKDPRESIGNKGIGFRSVLEVSRAPEIYSCAGEARGQFDGYCFRFSPEVLTESEAPLAELLDGADTLEWPLGQMTVTLGDLRAPRVRARCHDEGIDLISEFRHLSPYLLPLPAAPTDPRLQDFARRGFATVVRLPLASADAQAVAAARLRELDADTVVFLDGLDSLLVAMDDASRCLVRRRRALPDLQAEFVSVSDNTEHTAYWRWDYLLRDAEGLRRAAARLPGRWKELAEASLGIAVRVEGRACPGRFCIYLPTEVPTGTGALLHAPFFGDMSRKAIDFVNEPLNRLLRDTLANCLVEVVQKRLIGRGEVEARAVIDLLAPLPGVTSPWPTEVLRRLRGDALLLTDRGWRSAATARLAPALPDARIFTLQRVRQTAQFDAIHASLEGQRAFVASLLRALEAPTDPSDAELAATVATVAKDPGGSWGDFWREVERLLPGRAHALVGHAVLVDDQGALYPAKGANGVQVFFPRALGEGKTDAAPIAIPASLRSRIAFLASAIPLRFRRPDGREENTAIRRYLDPLVEDYRAETVLRAVLASAMPAKPVKLAGRDAELCGDALDLAVRLIQGARDSTSLVPELRRLRVPCQGGWFLPEECAFGPGWSGTTGDLLNEYLQAVATQDAIDVHDRLLLRPDHPAWRGHAAWLATVLSTVGVGDGLFPRPVPATTRLTFSMRLGVPVQLPGAPSGFAQSQWASYVATASSEVRPYFAGAFTYELVDVQGLVGLDRFDAMPPAGRRALTLLLFHSISRWPTNWQTSRFRKTSRQEHEGPISSFLLHALRTLRWVWCEDDGAARGATVGERWFVRATTESSQCRHFDHLRPLPQDLTRELVRLGAVATQALVALGMPLLDLDAETSDPRLLVDLAAALAQDRVAPAAKNIFLGQVRNAWHALHPTDRSELPAAVVVQRGGRPLEAHEPTEAEPIYLPDIATRGVDPGPFAVLPVAVMELRDAARLLSLLQRRLPGRVRALSSLRTEVLAAGVPWVRSEPAVRLMGSSMHWLATLALTVSAFAGPQAHGAQTKEFKQRLAAMRGTSIESVSGLAVRVMGLDGPSAEHPSAAVWDAATQTIVYAPEASGWLEALAGPLAQVLDRTDVVTPLRYALSKLPSDREPEQADVEHAVSAVEVSPTQLAEVRQLCTGDHAFVCERLRPVVELLAPGEPWSVFETAETEDALRTLLGAAVPADVEPAWLIELARESATDRAMGSNLFARIGKRAQLAAWNGVLSRLGAPYRILTNAQANDQFYEQRQAALLPLRAVARYLCLRDTSQSFNVLTEALLTCPAPATFATSFWTVPFEAVLTTLGAVFDGAPLPDSVRAALTGATSVEELVAALASADAAIEPTHDPADTHRENVATCQKTYDALRRTALAWCNREHANMGRWLDAGTMPSLLRARLDAGEGFLNRWSEHAAVVAIAAVAVREPAHAVFWRAVDGTSDVAALQRELALREAELAGVDDVLEAAHERRRRAARTLTVCGAPFEADPENMSRLWDHLAQQVEDACLPQVDPKQTPSLAEMPPVPMRANGQRRSGGGRRPPRLPEEQARLIGLAGEIFAYRMLRKHFGEAVVSPSVWVSENSRHRFPQNAADDGLGFDFRVVVGRRTWLIEVKATTGQETTFDLGPSEVRAAMECANDKRRTFRVLHVKEVLSTAPRAVFLPNPFSPDGQQHYRLDDAGLYVRYRLQG